MNGIELHDVLAVARWPAQDPLALLMDRVKPVDLTSQEILALVAVFESADQRVNAPGAGLRLVTLAGSDDLTVRGFQVEPELARVVLADFEPGRHQISYGRRGPNGHHRNPGERA